MSISEKRNIVAQLNNAFSDFKDMHEKSKNEIKKLGYESKETREVLEKLHDRMDDAETRLNRPVVQSRDIPNSERSPYAKAFAKWFRNGDEQALHTMKQEVKVTFPNLNETLDPDGGYLVFPEYEGDIRQTIVQHSPIREYAKKIKVGAKDLKIPVQQQAQDLETGTPLQGLFKTGWTADLGPVNQTDTGQIGMKIIPTNDLYALPFATQDMLDDAAFPLEPYIQENLARSIAYYEGNAFVLGTGVGQPTGILTSNTLNPFPSQATPTQPGTLQYSLGLSPNVLIEAYHLLPSYYANRGAWFMNRQTLRVIREWVDGIGQYLYTPAYGVTVAERAPSTILGCPYVECIDFPAPLPIDDGGYNAGQAIYADNTTCVAVFGDMETAYTIVDRMGIRVLRDPYTNKPFVQFFTTYRVGGDIVMPESLVAINVAPEDVS